MLNYGDLISIIRFCTHHIELISEASKESAEND